MRSFLLAASLIAASFSAFADGVDHPVPKLPAGIAAVPSNARAIATDGRDFLAVWNDESDLTPGLHAAVIRETGDPTRSLRLGTLQVIDSAAVWNGESYLVAWTERKDDYNYFYHYFAHWARLSAGGELLEKFDASPEFNEKRPGTVGMAVNGRNTLVVWTFAYFSVALHLLDRDGHVVHEASLGTYSAQLPHVFADGTGFLIFRQDEFFYGADATPPGPWQITAQRVDGGGTPAGDEIVVAEYEEAYGQYGIARSGTQFVLTRVVVSIFSPSVKPILRTRRISGDLKDVVRLPEVELPSGFVNAGVACDGLCTAFAQSSNHATGGVLTFRLDAVRDTVGAPLPFLPGGASYPRIAWNGRNYLVLWTADRLLSSLQCDAVLQPLAGASPQPVVVRPASQSMVAAASGGDTALITWFQYANGPAGDLMAAVTDGEHLTRPVRFATALPTSQAVIHTDFGYLALWTEYDGGVKAIRLSAAGEPLDAAPLTIASTSRNNSVTAAAAGKTLMVTWVSSSDILSARLQADGTLMDATPVKIAGGSDPWIASNGSIFLVTWLAGGTPRAMRITPDGRTLDPGGIGLSQRYCLNPTRVASDGRDFLVFIYDQTSVLRAKRITASGAILDGGDGVGLIPEPAQQPYVALAGSDGRYFVVLSRWSPGVFFVGSFDSQLVFRTSTPVRWPTVTSMAVAPLSGDRYVVVTSHTDDDPPFDPRLRVYYRLVGPAARRRTALP